MRETELVELPVDGHPNADPDSRTVTMAAGSSGSNDQIDVRLIRDSDDEEQEYVDAPLLGTQEGAGKKPRWWSKLGLPKRGHKFQRLKSTDDWTRDPAERWCPEESANLFSRLFFMYVNGLVDIGYKKHLTKDDVWDIAKRDESKQLYLTYEKQLHATKDPIKRPEGSVLRSLWRTHKSRFLWAGVIKFMHDLLTFTRPIILEFLLKHLEKRNGVQDADSKGMDDRQFFLKGTLLASSLFVVSMAFVVLINQYFHILYRIGIQLKAQLTHMLYHKTLKITSAVKSEKGVGATVNLESNDAGVLGRQPQYLHIIWSGPFQIIVILGMLIRILGWAPSFAGLMVTVGLIPVNTVIGIFMEKSRKAMMKHTDERVKLTSEVITGIKAIKLYAWEQPFVEKISEIRRQELKHLRTMSILGELTFLMFGAGSVLVAMAAFGVFVAMGGELTASIAFPALALFNMLEFPIAVFPMQIMGLVTASVALKRLQSFMKSDEIDEPDTGHHESAAEPVKIENGTFSWAPDEPPVLTNLNLSVKPGQLVVIVGEVGSGKSSVLGALIGEMHASMGHAYVSGSIAYTAQDPWIQNATLQKNILMDKELDEEFYAQVLSGCALPADLELLPAGDQTEIGEKGVNLSGGQKHRVALARACYSDADVFLLDDPLSAVDAHVGRHLFDKCICTLLGNKTRVLVTHQLQFLPHADVIVVMDNGKISEVGTYQELVARGVHFSEFVHSRASNKSKNDDNDNDVDDDEDTPNNAEDADVAKETKDSSNEGKEVKKKNVAKKGELTKDEEREYGTVKFSVYLQYMKSWGPCFIMPLIALVLIFGEVGMQGIQNWWLSVWSKGTGQDPSSSTTYYLKIYYFMGLSSIVFSIAKHILLLFGSLNASRMLSKKLLEKVIRLPMSFFDTQPSGRLLNRFTRDTGSLDTTLMFSFNMTMFCIVFALISVIIIIGVAQPVAVIILILSVLYYRTQRRFIATSRELQRLNSIAQSPIYSHLQETLQGLETVRAFKKQAGFVRKNEALVDESIRMEWPMNVCNRWLGIRLEFTDGWIVFFAALVSVLLKSEAGLAGLALTSALNLTGLLDWMVRQISELEVNMNCVERIVEYERYDSEKASIIPGSRPPSHWPSKGAISVSDLWVRYREDLDPVLKGVSFEIKGGERIGICGRTGCGKSTLMMSLYRIVEPYAGSVVIDGIDSTAIGLFDLRSHLSLVPQDPVIFSGTIRSNLDPFGTAEGDAALWEVLKKAGLTSFVQDLEGGLDASISEGGGNLSVGQRQLLCMARALLRGSRILILDEATSNVDNATDSLIQNTIRSAFEDYTVLTIAHRLHTIIDYDRIMVMDGGELKEFDSPQALLSNPGSLFSKLIEESRNQMG